jgi:hypothetical protein
MRRSILLPTAALASALALTLGCADQQQSPTAPALGDDPPRISASGKPTRSLVPFSPIEFPAGVFCSFAVAIEFPVARYVAKTFPPDANGDVVVLQTGHVTARITNLSTGKSITYNISGPTRYTYHVDGSVTIELPGPQSLLGFNNYGRIVVEVSPEGEFTFVKQTGHAVDVCAALA